MFSAKTSFQSDEQLIAQVKKHRVIYNRHKYTISEFGGTQKYQNKDSAWHSIALAMGTDVLSVKKRWKYLRERYVQQRKQGDPPSFEHLSRPYLEKMKFLDQHIQSRKSYRNVTSFLQSPNGQNSSSTYQNDFIESSSRSEESTTNPQYPVSYQKHLKDVFKLEPYNDDDATFPVTSKQKNFKNSRRTLSPKLEISGCAQTISEQCHYAEPEIAISTSEQLAITAVNHEIAVPERKSEFRDSEIYTVPSSSSSLKSPMSETRDGSSSHTRPRIEMNCTNNESSNRNRHRNTESSDDETALDRNSCSNREAHFLPANNSRISGSGSTIHSNNDYLCSLIQQLPQNRQILRSSEQLLGELVTSELLKMPKERRKTAQKKILEVLFFDD